MGHIKKLPRDVINKIAAGEVVERPASVVKELLENAIDAGANEISILIEKGGTHGIIVNDNGLGISREDLPLTIERYATSKISSADDLFSITTHGFRGEALSSIAEVSRFVIQSRTSSDDAVLMYSNSSGVWKETEVAGPIGTKVEVRELFSNVPARKKFLKTGHTEYSHILKIVTEYALLYFKVAFTLTHGGKLSVQWYAASDWQTRVRDVLGDDYGKGLATVDFKDDLLHVSGFVSKPQFCVADRKQQYVFVNRRSVRDAIVFRAVADAYEGLIPRGKYPVTILHLECDPHAIDVNVHPRKTEVKFADTNAVYKAVVSAVRNAIFTREEAVRTASQFFHGNKITRDDVAKSIAFQAPTAREKYASAHPSFNILNKSDHFPKVMPQDTALSQSLLPDSGTPDWNILGQLAKKYILASKDDTLYIFDQHALGEGVLYQKLLNQARDKGIKAQKLLLPLNAELPQSTFDDIFHNLDVFSSLGFSLHEFGKRSIQVTEVPSDLSGVDILALILKMASDLDHDLELKTSRSFDEKKLRLLRVAACRSAVMFEDHLEHAQMERMLRDRDALSVTACAHGRPVFWEMSFTDLNKKFARC